MFSIRFILLAIAFCACALAYDRPSYAQTVQQSLAGVWEGRAIATNFTVRNRFSAQLTDDGGRIEGSIEQPNLLPGQNAEDMVQSIVKGTVVGRDIVLEQIYVGTSGQFQRGTLTGKLDPDGRRIRGTYAFPSATGEFEMVRPGMTMELRFTPLATKNFPELGNWQGFTPSANVFGENFFSAAGLPERALRTFVEGSLGGKVTLLPVRELVSESASMAAEGKRFVTYATPFCRADAPTCKDPFTSVDGVWVVQPSFQNVDHYVYYRYSDQNVFCRLRSGAFDCRPPPAFFPRGGVSLDRDNMFDVIDFVKNGYNNSPNRFATAQPVNSDNPNLGCLAWGEVRTTIDTVTADGRVVASQAGGITANVKNACRYPIQVTIQLGSAGGCQRNMTAFVSDLMFGEQLNFRLVPGESWPVGACRGVVTRIDRAG